MPIEVACALALAVLVIVLALWADIDAKQGHIEGRE